MKYFSQLSSRVMFILAIVLILACSTAIGTPRATPSTSEDVTALAQETYGRLAQIYRSGGSAPELIGRLNDALGLVHEAQLKRLSGDESGAVALEEQARVIILQVASEASSVQQKAQQDSTNRTVIAIVTVPLVSAISTLVFYAALRTRRRHEKARVFGMRIVEKKKPD